MKYEAWERFRLSMYAAYAHWNTLETKQQSKESLAFTTSVLHGKNGYKAQLELLGWFDAQLQANKSYHRAILVELVYELSLYPTFSLGFATSDFFSSLNLNKSLIG